MAICLLRVCFRLFALGLPIPNMCFSTGPTLNTERPAVATVVVFLGTECPISQQYTRPLTALQRQYAARGVRFESSFPSPTDSQVAITAFSKSYALPFGGQPDPGRVRVRRYKAMATPEAVLLDKRGIIVYQGAIDDWFVALGRHRREPTQHYLRDALNALLSGRPVPTARAEPIGCRIQQ